jgi:P-type Mg2+ transporter
MLYDNNDSLLVLILSYRYFVACRSRPGRLLLISALIVTGISLVLPYVPFNFLVGFVPLPAPLVLTMLVLVALFVLVTEIANKLLYSRVENQTA